MPFHVVLFEPEIPGNTGNIMRLCANSGCHLHLIEPLGFALDEQKLRRAGMDYRDWVNVKTYKNLEEFSQLQKPERIFACTTKGQQNYSTPSYQEGDVFLFGPESRGLPLTIRESIVPERRIFIPMHTDSRSLNLANAVAIIIYEAWRQCDWR